MKWKEWFIKYERILLVLTASAGLTGLLVNLEFNLLEANLYDFRMSRGPQPKANSNIVLITVDDKTTKALDEFAPLPLDYHARLMEELERFDPKAVGYLVDLNAVNQENPDLFQSEWGTRFVEASTRLESRGIVVILGTPYDVTGEVLPPFPLSSLSHSVAVIHKDGNVFAEDKITRRALTYLNGRPVFHIDLAQRLGFISYGQEPRGSYYVPEVESKYFFFRYHGNPTMASAQDDAAGRAGRMRSDSHEQDRELPYPRYSFVDVLQGNVPKEALQGKILLVGTLSKENASDFAFTPFSKASYTNPKLVLHANILDSIIRDDGIVRAPNWANYLTTFTVVTIVFWWVLNSTPLYGVFATIGLALIFSIIGHVLFQLKGIWLKESQPLVGIFVGYYLVVPYRLIREYKKRWDYQKKNELLTQVEELKTNFLSLVTHDLKTPVARIQGLAETLGRKSADHLSPQDFQSLRHIIGSAEELNRFISSILELSKVESDHLTIKFESRDLNQIIERCAETFATHAKSRNIDLVVNLEPLFPIKMDSALISKVINNLIDNAIKYSPAGGQVAVSSREVDHFVEVQIADQGIGMSEEERKSLFTRFYRAKNDTTTQIAGTGLGLYLTKFFIEAHHGRVEVESTQGKGSVFRIILPIDMPIGNQPGLKKSLEQGTVTAAKPLANAPLPNGSAKHEPRQGASKKESSHV